MRSPFIGTPNNPVITHCVDLVTPQLRFVKNTTKMAILP